MCGADTVADQQLGCPEHDVEQFAGAIVVVRGCPAGSACQHDPLAAERTSGRAAVGVEPASHRGAADHLGLILWNHHHVT